MRNDINHYRTEYAAIGERGVARHMTLITHSHSSIGLDKPTVRAKGIHHPKYSVEAEYACLKRESATT